MTQDISEQPTVEQNADSQPESILARVTELIEDRDALYAEAVAALNSERAALEEESRAILTAANEMRLLLPARARTVQAESDALLLAGRTEEAQAKLEEQRQAENAPAEIEAQRRTIAQRLEEIEREKRSAGRRVFEEWFPFLREELVEEQLTLCDALDSAWSACETFAVRTGNQEWPHPLATPNTRLDLTAREQGSERPLFHRLVDWFGYGRR